MVAPGEPLWLDEDLAYAKALYAVEADECPGCGHPKTVTTQLASAEAYTANLLVCHACAAKSAVSKAYLSHDDGTAGGDPAGLLISVQRRP